MRGLPGAAQTRPVRQGPARDVIAIQLVGGIRDVTAALDAFPVDYHYDFFAVRKSSKPYLASTDGKSDSTATLSRQLRKALLNWGAGKRKAPDVQDVDVLNSALQEPAVHRNLALLSQTPLQTLGVLGRGRTINGQEVVRSRVIALDALLIQTLNLLADRLFVGNTNATYPMKALLLLTGHTPALDSQVRAGLVRAGLSGMSTTQFLLPRNADAAAGMKITRLPYVLGQCWSESAARLIEGAARSRFPDLRNDAGRLFDVLLFVQAQPDQAVILTHTPDDDEWYRLT